MLTEFIKLDDREFIETEIDVQSFNSEDDLAQYINDLNILKENFYKIVLVGKRNFEIDTKKILNVLNSNNVLKLEDKTKLNYDLNEIASENNLRGIFVRETLKLLENSEYSEDEIYKAIEIGLEVM